jgi:hypothetical protein
MERSSNLYENLINRSLEISDKNILAEIQSAINKTYWEIEKTGKIVNLLFFGGFSCGKTTMITSLIAYLKKDFKEYIDLPSSESENTFYITIIEASPDESYHLFRIENDNKVIDLNCNDHKKINQKLEEIDRLSTNYLSKLKKYEKEENLTKKKDLENEIPGFIIKIQIPSFKPNLRLIDCPGITMKKIKERIFKLIRENYLFTVFIYTKSLTEPCLSNKEIHTFFDEIQAKYMNSLFFICLTKYDELIELKMKGSQFYLEDKKEKKRKEKTIDLIKLNESFKEFKNEIKEYSKYINVNEIFIIDNYHIIEEDEKLSFFPRQQMEHFLSQVEKIIENKGNHIRQTFLKNKLIDLFNEINQKHSKDSVFSQDQIEILIKNTTSSSEKFEKEINSFHNNYPKKLDDFKIRYKDKINLIKEKFDFNEKTNLSKQNYACRSTYIKDQYEFLFNYLIGLIDDDIEVITKNNFNRIFEDLPPDILEKLNNILTVKASYDDSNDKEKLKYTSLIGGSSSLIASVAIGFGVRAAIMAALETGATASAAGVVAGPVGIGVGILIGVGSLIYSFSDYIAIWSRENCFEAVLEYFHLYLTNEKTDGLQKIINTKKEGYKFAINSLHNNLNDIKERLNLFDPLLDLLKEFDKNGNNNEKPLKIDELFNNIQFQENEIIQEKIKKFISLKYTNVQSKEILLNQEI